MNFSTTRGLFLLPSYSRPHLLKRFFERYELTRAVAPGVVILADSDPAIYEYHRLWLPDNWSFYVQEQTEEEPVRCFAASLRGWMKKFFYCASSRPFDWLGFLTDDHYPISVNWDAEIVEGLEGNIHIVSSNDLWKAPYRMTGVQVHSAKILNAVGYFFPPDFKHLFIDDVWEHIGRFTGTWDIKMDVVVKHIHYLNETARGKAEKDEVYNYAETLYADDQALFNTWVRLKLPGVLERVRGIL